MKTTARVACLLPLFLTAGTVQAQSKESPVDFNRDVRPILSERCFQCHGPDQGQRKADLRLDTQDGIFADRGDYAAVVPRKPDESELWARITADIPEFRMPPADSGRTLTEQEVATIKRWIEQGAEWKGHWAYLPPQRPKIPEAVGPEGSIRNEIDRFIFAKLNEKGMQPSPVADRVTLIRRLSFDLTGLPPTPDEVAAFVNDTSPDAYERLIDRLLESPHYGERMAMYWLDLVRFADTNGYHGDNHRDIWLYRDYVIEAFNDNKPFDEFTIEQLAGDLLPDATREQKIASGYNRLLMTTREGGAQPKEYRAKYAADRVRNASTVWLGATLGCAECHDHKFDPYTAKDFYSFASFFADLQEIAVGKQPPTQMPTLAERQRLQEFNQQIASLEEKLATQTPELDAAQAEWEKSVRTWTVLQPSSAVSENGARLEIHGDQSILAQGDNPNTDTYFVHAQTSLKGITALRLEVLPDESLPQRGPGRAANGNFVLNEVELSINGSPVEWSQITATHSQKAWDVQGAADGDPKTGWAILEQTGRANEAVFEFEKDWGDGEAAELKLVLHHNYGSQHAIGRLRISVTNTARPVTAGSLPREIEDVLALEPSQRTEEQKDALSAHFRRVAPQLEPVRKQLAELKARSDEFSQTIATTLVSTSSTPRMMRVLPRGNWLDDSGEVVRPAVPIFLLPLETDQERATRLDLAHWMVDPDNPLVARVFVNRLWKLMFGEGIVRTLDDFGSQGQWPSHPRLLDWLALEFIESGWDVRHMVKLIVMSGTYRQSSSADDEQLRRDPFNEWLGRQGRFRLDAEIVRDNALAVSGLLARKIGGPSAKPYQPAGYWAHLNFPKRVYQHDTDEDQYRRGFYTYWCRTFLHPSLLAFDATTREECTVERPRSNTPLQALVLLNDPTYVEAARALAERIIREGGGEAADRIQFAYQTVLSRKPRPEELQLLTAIQQRHSQQYESGQAAAKELLSVGLRPLPSDLDVAELASWTSVARVILNLHETITRY